MPNRATVSINGAYNSAVLENWSMSVGEDLALIMSFSNPGENVAAWGITLTAYNPDGSTFFTNVGTVTNGTTCNAAFSVNSSNTNTANPGPYLADVTRTDAGFRTQLSYGTINLWKPAP